MDSGRGTTACVCIAGERGSAARVGVAQAAPASAATTRSASTDVRMDAIIAANETARHRLIGTESRAGCLGHDRWAAAIMNSDGLPENDGLQRGGIGGKLALSGWVMAFLQQKR